MRFDICFTNILPYYGSRTLLYDTRCVQPEKSDILSSQIEQSLHEQLDLQDCVQ